MRTLIVAALGLALLTTAAGCGKKEEPIPTLDTSAKRGGMRPGGKVATPAGEVPANPNGQKN
jgi:hypothetical protein